MKKQKILTLFVTVMLTLTLSTNIYARGGHSRGGSHYAKSIAAAGLGIGAGVAAHSAYSKTKPSVSSQNNTVTPPADAPSAGSGYYTGKRGGCYTYTAGGNKRYVDRSFCK